ncbi:MAG TPA: NUDIX domain-containing protein [Marmoricola sp.]|nr:NUDIX domain-containing protein [Marmoricola sp.]
MTEPVIVVAAGAVVLREEGEVLLVHRPKYDDWSFPKGKLDPGEEVRTAAVREVLEETGVEIRLGPPLTDQGYAVLNGVKVVHYWVGSARFDEDVTSYSPNDEIDEVRWVEVERAHEMLNYARDRQTLEEATQLGPRTEPLVVLRHADARSRKQWQGDDRERTLTPGGEHQAALLSSTLASYGIERLVSSSSRRCWTTLAPYGVLIDEDIEVTDALSEEDATPGKVADEVEELLEAGEPVVVCSHRKVLPMVFEALGVDPPPLDKGAMLVLHHRRGLIAALERIPAPPAG